MPSFKRRTKAEKRAMAKAKERRQSKNKEGLRLTLRRIRREGLAMSRGEWVSDHLHTILTRLDPAIRDKVTGILRRMARTSEMIANPKDN